MFIIDWANGATISCTISNDDQPATLTVTKDLTTDSGSDATCADFSFTVDAGSSIPFEADCSNDVTVDAGSHTVVEDAAPGFDTTYLNDVNANADCDSLAVANGATISCTISNDDQPGTLRVTKVLPNDSGSGATCDQFSFSVDGDPAVAFNLSCTNDVLVAAGTHTVVEDGTPISGFDTTYGNNQNLAADCADLPIVNGGAAGDVTCTITNDDQAPVDSTAPTVTIDSLTGSTGTDTTSPFAALTDSGASVTWHANENGNYTVVRDGTNCSDGLVIVGPTAYTTQPATVATSISSGTLSEGDNTLRVCVTDAASNPGASEDVTVTKDTIDPVLTLVTPANGSWTNDTTPTFSGVAGILAGDSSTVTVNIYSGPTATGIPVQTLSPTRNGVTGAYTIDSATLANGQYTAKASQTDWVGHIGYSSANTFRVDTVAPVVNITKVNNSTVSFPFFTNQNLTRLDGTCGTALGDSSTVSWSLVGPSPSVTAVRSGTAACSSGTWTSGTLTSVSVEGAYSANVSQSDTATNTGTASKSIVLDKTKPNVTVNQALGQADPTKVSPVHFTVVFSETVTGLSAASLSFSGTANRGSPTLTPILANLSWDVSVPLSSNGTVIATIGSGKVTDLAGNSNNSSTSTDNTITYDTVAPDTTITGKPTNPSNDPNPIFSFTSTQTPATFECKLDAGSWTSCSSPQPYASLASISHTFSVRATDAAGNTDATPATYTWTINAPGVSCGLCVLEPSQTGLELTGSGQITVNNGGVLVNSSDQQQAVKVGSSAHLTGTYIGGPSAPAGFQQTGGGIYTPAPVYMPAINDPLATLVQCPAAGSVCPTTVRADVVISGTTALTINPGIYNNIQVTNSAKLTLAAGTYIIKGSLKVGGQASIIGAGVTLYLACPAYPTPCGSNNNGAVVELTGTGTLSMSGPTTGAFKNVTIFADRNNINTSKISSNGTGFAGIVYLKSGRLQLTGNGNALTTKIVVGTLTIGGTGSLTINVP
jgi:hypothetical protein